MDYDDDADDDDEAIFLKLCVVLWQHVLFRLVGVFLSDREHTLRRINFA